MRVLVALLEIERMGLMLGGRPWDNDFNLVRFFVVPIFSSQKHAAWLILWQLSLSHHLQLNLSFQQSHVSLSEPTTNWFEIETRIFIFITPSVDNSHSITVFTTATTNTFNMPPKDTKKGISPFLIHWTARHRCYCVVTSNSIMLSIEMLNRLQKIHEVVKVAHQQQQLLRVLQERLLMRKWLQVLPPRARATSKPALLRRLLWRV
jgi:hypothetical protein